MRKGSRLLLGLGGFLIALLLAAAAAPFLIPVSAYIPELEKAAAKALGQPVAVADLKLHLVPTPRAIATGIRIGKKSDVKVGELEIVPELVPLLSGRKELRLVRAAKVEVQESALTMLDRLPKSEGPPMAVHRIELSEVTLRHSKFKLPVFNLSADLGAENALEQVRVETRDGAFHLQLDSETPAKSKINLIAKHWTLPAGAPLTFDSLRAQGALAGKQIQLPRIEGELYGGKISGSAKLEWARLWQVGGKLDLAGVDVARMLQALGKKPSLQGKLNANTTYSAAAKAPDQLAKAIAADGPFNIAGAVYQGMDFSKVASLSAGKVTGEGVTRFDELRGKLMLRGERVRVNEICARSPALVAAGYVEIAPDQTLTGKLDVSVAKTGGFVGAPVALGGTTSNPTYTLGKGMTAGAIVGTVLLPGIGTAIGSSIGGAAEGKSACK